MGRETETDSDVADSTTPGLFTEKELTYEIIEEEDEYFIVFNDEEITNNEHFQNGWDSLTIKFASLSELREKVATNSLSDSQKAHIRRVFPRDDTGAIKICNLGKLYSPILPERFEITGVYWYGEIYTFDFENEQEFGYVTYCTEETYLQEYEYEYEDFFNRDNISLSRRKQIEDRNAEEFYYETLAGSFKQVRYTLTTENKTLIIDETYRLFTIHSDLSTSDTVPSRIGIYGIDNGVYFIVSLNDLIERPSVEWLLSIGMELYS